MGLPTLYLDPFLNAPAVQHSDDMATNLFLSHTGSDGSTPSSRAGIPISENVAYGGSLLGIHNAWMNSAGHKANILRSTSTRVGVGATVTNLNGWDYVFGTQVFAGRDFAAFPLTTAEKNQVISDASTAIVNNNPHISQINQVISSDLQDYIDNHQGSSIFTYMFGKGHCCSVSYNYQTSTYPPNFTSNSFVFSSTYQAIGVAMEVVNAAAGQVKVWAFATSSIP